MFFFVYRILASVGLVIFSPVLAMCYVFVKLDSPGPFLFTQKRMGKGRKPFTMYKIRTMINGAERMQVKLKKKNEADGPVFKIADDPRFTQVGKVIARMALDELPQLINVVKGDMSLVGPRPLPVAEARKVPKKYAPRFTVLPGMTSEWVVQGQHELSFKRWMEMDVWYVQNRSVYVDIQILGRTILQVISFFFMLL